MRANPDDQPAPRETGPDKAAPLGVLLLSAFGLGLSPVMPGTVASLATAALLYAAAPAVGAFLALTFLLTLFGVVVTLRFGDAASGPDAHGDPGWVVSDEVAGQALACLGALPLGASLESIAASFVLFRVFDMLKPPPVSTLERLPGGRGILMDDIAAGLIAGVLTLLIGAFGLLPG